MNNNIKSPYLNIWKYWLHSWDFWPAYPVMTRYFATSAMREIFMFCNIQMKMALQKKMIFETECHHWKLLLDSGWCVCLCVRVHACTYTFTHTHTHTHTHTFMTLHLTWHYSIYTLSNVQHSRRNNVSNSDLFLLSGMRMERYLLSWVWLRKPVTITLHPTSDASTYICTYDHNSWWYCFAYLPQTKLDQMCTQTGSFVTWIAQWLD
jgi:hypothetical protein